MTTRSSRTPKPVVTITWEKVVKPDYDSSPPDIMSDGYWPSKDPSDPGYIGENPKVSYAEQFAAAKRRLRAYDRGEWWYVGVKARATIAIKWSHGTTTYRLDSPGVWGVESDCPDAIQEIYQYQKAELLSDLRALAREILK